MVTWTEVPTSHPRARRPQSTGSNFFSGVKPTYMRCLERRPSRAGCFAGRVLSGDHALGSAFVFLFGEQMAAWVREEPA